MMDRCPRCGVGFVVREPFVRVDTLARVASDDRDARPSPVGSAFFHLRCAPWGDPKYRISRPAG